MLKWTACAAFVVVLLVGAATAELTMMPIRSRTLEALRKRSFTYGRLAGCPSTDVRRREPKKKKKKNFFLKNIQVATTFYFCSFLFFVRFLTRFLYLLQFYGTLTIGSSSNAQSLNVLIDTGSSITAVAGPNCCSGVVSHTYNPANARNLYTTIQATYADVSLHFLLPLF